MYRSAAPELSIGCIALSSLYLLHVVVVGLFWLEHDLAFHCALDQVAPALVDCQARRMTDDQQRAAGACDAHVDTPLICHEADGAVVHTRRPDTAEDDNVLLTALEVVSNSQHASDRSTHAVIGGMMSAS